MLDAEALGLPVVNVVRAVNAAAPRWVGFNLLAPTYEVSAEIAATLGPTIKVMLGGHQAKAMPTEILIDPRMARCEALVIGEGETRTVELLADHRAGRRPQRRRGGRGTRRTTPRGVTERDHGRGVDHRP